MSPSAADFAGKRAEIERRYDAAAQRFLGEVALLVGDERTMTPGPLSLMLTLRHFRNAIITAAVDAAEEGANG